MTPKNIIVHHTASVATPGRLQLQAVNEYHRTKDWGGGARIPKSSIGWYVAYHYFIDTDGKMTQCANDSEIRWHAGARNIDSIGICLAGRFDKGFNTIPTTKQTLALQALLWHLTEKYKIPPARVYPHRKFAKKTCPGNNLPDDWASKLAIMKKTYQVLNVEALKLYKPNQTHKLPDGRIVLNDNVTPIPNTTKIITL